MKWKMLPAFVVAMLIVVAMCALMLAPGTQPVLAGAGTGEAAGQTVVPRSLVPNVGTTPVASTVVTETIYFTNNGLAWVRLINNDDTEIITGTFETTATSYGLAVADVTYYLDPGETWIIGPFNSGLYNDEDGDVKLTWSAGDGVAIAPTPQTIEIYRIVP